MSFENLIRTLSSTIYQGNVRREHISVTKSFRRNSFCISHKKSIAYSLLIRSSQYRQNDALVIKKSSLELSTPLDILNRYTRIYSSTSIDRNVDSWQTYRLRGGKAARKKNDLTWQKKRAEYFQDSLYVSFFSFSSLYQNDPAFDQPPYEILNL